MGITSSTADQHKYFGFRIYKLFPEGPLALSNSNLTELDEFIIPPEEVLSNEISFYEFVKNNLNKPLRLNIYSAVRRFIYSIEVIPRNDWGDPKNGFLGACVRYENWATAHVNILRVIKVKENSVADKCLKLKALEDYIISLRPEGKDFVTLNQDNSDPLTIFHEILLDNIANFVEIFIYNVKEGPRSVKIFLEQNQEEILGCDVAYGKLHELPKINDDEKDKDLKYVSGSESRNVKKEDFVLEETRKILKGNLDKKEKSGNDLVLRKQKEAAERDFNFVGVNESDNFKEKIEVEEKKVVENENEININLIDEIKENDKENVEEKINENVEQKINENVKNINKENVEEKTIENVKEKFNENVKNVNKEFVEEKTIENVEEKTIENVMDVNIENTEEKTIENVEEKTIENTEEKINENTEEKINENVEQKIKENVEEKTIENVEEKFNENVKDVNIENVEEKTIENVEEKTIENVKDVNIENTEEKTIENVEEKTIENTEEKINENVEQKINENVEEKINENVEQKINENSEEKINENVEDVIIENTEEHNK